MLLAIDVGNTNITCAVISGEETKANFRLTTKQSRTSDEFGIIICDLLEKRGVKQTDITDVIKERTDVPVSSRTKATFSTEGRTMDPSASFGQGATYLPTSGVNESKTIYTDDLGRLHFFGKGNLIKE